MKKFLYIVLVIIVLLIIARLVKNEAPTAEPESVTVEETVVTPDSVESEIDAVVAEPENADMLGDGEVVDENIEETNPAETADEDETIVKE